MGLEFYELGALESGLRLQNAAFCAFLTIDPNESDKNVDYLDRTYIKVKQCRAIFGMFLSSNSG